MIQLQMLYSCWLECPIINKHPQILTANPALKSQTKLGKTTWGQSYKTFYTLGQINKCTLKHVNNPMRQTFVHHNVRTLHPNIFIGLHFSF